MCLIAQFRDMGDNCRVALTTGQKPGPVVLYKFALEIGRKMYNSMPHYTASIKVVMGRTRTERKVYITLKS